ncbi:myo-inositol 2-dehydrogenase [Marinomonas sp. CT5]|uniref:Gfo/Idh/MocA family oxidoreductase n=1 Tax=Marinomonas sp. CT5 TaxID=2066133 RepID=UPI001BAF7194|nr:Gfo/Idh/MocA family oxidoreductase [Marinomonas sp. CT5]QUX94499.1 myo-inositol 2-dehydrogenase [Marinomonas sp. CT5]
MIWLIGSGGMSVDYTTVLNSLGVDYIVVGRGANSAEEFKKRAGVDVVVGGTEKLISESTEVPDAAIISVGVEQLYNVTSLLIEFGVKNILVEKPAALSFNEIDDLYQLSIKKSCSIFIAYNRRFFSSVLELRSRVIEEGGVTSFNFEFTEWSHKIEKLDKPEIVLEKWLLSNSTHIVDLAFYLGGKPSEIASFVRGGVSWHPNGSVFTGSGVTEKGALFSYCANWESAGRWAVEVLTKENRYYLSPIEELQVQKRGQINKEAVEINDQLDKSFKPGLYKQVKAFLEKDHDLLCSIKEHRDIFSVYEKIAGY